MINKELVDSVVSKVESAYLGEAVMNELRELYPEVRFTYCMYDDVSTNAKPVMETDKFNVYFVDAREHCMCLTNDFDIASGIVLAEIIEDDD